MRAPIVSRGVNGVTAQRSLCTWHAVCTASVWSGGAACVKAGNLGFPRFGGRPGLYFRVRPGFAASQELRVLVPGFPNPRPPRAPVQYLHMI